ncbi:metallopeptidase family protein [Roseivivax sp. GX 12232]|uniref:metallopeptidase family protein n=1 Tax=Roseivivax sp. GX 12232 TaxID=2900547 RepID=UPI001E380DFF|nr:metallopeptidase family protein [Roseivivax sp. GX 12232]MCE0504326.1 metallopeptidase family protein [Roseivivax sp. GX 12232]
MEEMARRAIAALPPAFARGAAEIVLRVEDWPDAEILRELEIPDPIELTGLYDGIPMTEKSVADPAPWPDTIWLYREPILAEWRDRGDVEIEDLVAHVTVHELAHHFGWSDEDIATIDRWWE